MEVLSDSSSNKVIDWIQECNEKLCFREFDKLEPALEFIFNKYLNKLQKAKTRHLEE